MTLVDIHPSHKFTAIVEDPSDPPDPRWNFQKKSKAVIAVPENGTLGGIVLSHVGGHLEREINDYGQGIFCEDLDIDVPDEPGIYVWEGAYKETPSSDRLSEVERVCYGECRAPTDDEWEWIKRGACPWDWKDWVIH